VEALRGAAPQATTLLFASYARRAGCEESDLDLLVIEARRLVRRMEAARLRAVLSSLGIRVNPPVVDDQMFQEWRQTPGMIVDWPPGKGASYPAIGFGVLTCRFLAGLSSGAQDSRSPRAPAFHSRDRFRVLLARPSASAGEESSFSTQNTENRDRLHRRSSVLNREH
jgi:hypothetical protein